MLLDLGFSCLIRLDSWLPAPHIVEPPKRAQSPSVENLVITSDWMSTWVAHIPPCLNFYLQLPRGLGYLGFLAAGEIAQPRSVQYAGYFDPGGAKLVTDHECLIKKCDPNELLIEYQSPFWIVDQNLGLWKLQLFNKALLIDPLKEWYLYIKKKELISETNSPMDLPVFSSHSGFLSQVPHSLIRLIGVGIKMNFFAGFQFWDSLTHENLLGSSSEQFVSNLLSSSSEFDCYPLGFISKKSGVFYRSHYWKIN